ncbi:hypothetical protein [Nioella aestuarii]|uniref:hypothetical protein n=1 Tax=Nioella aestuarii TaxID=1662864 RepID=UPI003D7F962E
MRDVLASEADQLDRLRENRDGFLVDDGVNGATLLSEDQVQRVFSTLMLQAMLGEGEAQSIEEFLTGSAASRLLREAAAGFLERMSAGAFGSGQIDLATVHAALSDEFLAIVAAIDLENREALADAALARREEITHIGAMLSQAEARLSGPAGGMADILTEGGYYVIRFSGGGYQNRNGWQSAWVEGYSNRVIQVSSTFTDIALRSIWQFPVGSSVDQFEQDQQREARQRAIDSVCNRGSQRGPYGYLPTIWVWGPEFEIIAGPFPEIAEALDVSGGSDGAVNLEPGSANQWQIQTERPDEEFYDACRALGWSAP